MITEDRNESVVLWRRILEFVGDGVLNLDGDGRITSCSRSSTRLFGWSEREMLGKPWEELMAEHARPDVQRAVKLAWLGEPSQRVEVQGRRRDGRTFPLWCTVAPVTHPGGGVVEILVVAQDRTESQLYESTLADFEVRVREGEALARMGTWVWDAVAGTVQWSAGLHAVRKVDPVSFEGTMASHLSQILAEDRDAVDAAMRAALDDGRDFESEYRLLVEGEELRWVQGRARPVRDADGQIVGLWGVEQDVTERQRATEAILLAQDRAERASRAKGGLLSRMSHELRTPLNAILGFSQLLELGPLAPEQAEAVEQISRAGQHLLELIDEVLDLARVGNGRLTPTVAPLPLAPIIEEAMELVASLARERDVTVEKPGLTDSIWVRADRQWLRQVLVHLLSNAVKYNRKGGTVTLRLEAGPDDVGISIADTGIGISPDKISHLFEPFARLAAHTGEAGTGLGMTLSRELVELMGGTIEVESQLGIGSTFTLRVPSSVAENRPTSVSEPAGSGLKERLRAVGPMTVVYVEDNPVNALVMERTLAINPDIRLTVVTHGQQALPSCRREHPDIVLLDLHLPDESGTDVLVRLTADEETARVPVVIVSADADRETIKAHMKLGAAGYLAKPFKTEELVDLLVRCGKGGL